MNTLILNSSKDIAVIDSQNIISSDYLKIMSLHPVLDQHEEHELAVSLYEHNDVNSAQKLVFSNLRGVVYVARNYQGYGLPLMDMIQEGTIGLMKAVKQYNPFNGVRLFAYALPWIKSEIQQYVIKNWKLVKAATTDAKKKLFFNLRSLKNKLLPLNKDYVSAISKELNVSKKDVLDMDGYMNGSDSDVTEILEYSNDDTPESLVISKQQVQLEQNVIELINDLSEREQFIIRSRFLSEPQLTLQELSLKLNISLERVRQLEKQSLLKLKNLVDNKLLKRKIAL